MLTVLPPHVSPQQSPGISGYTPQEIQQIYGFNLLPQVNGTTIDGSGETIAIVDAYYDPDITSDANTFNSQFGLPLFNSPGGPTLTVVASGGGPASGLSQDSSGGWPLETSLDVEWSHAMAPGANILLVEAPDGSNDSAFDAVQYAASQPGVVVVSMSWGANEFSGETNYDSIFQPKSSSNPNGYTNPGVTFVAASGDSGAGAIYPAASPYVLSTGGTTLGSSTSSTGGGTSGLGTSGLGSSSFGSFASYGPGFSAFPRAGGGLYRGIGALTVTPTAPPPPRGSATSPPPTSPPGSPPSSPPSSYPGESAWSGSGGGPASYEGYPSYQYDQSWIATTYGYPYNVEVTNNSNGSTSDYSARMTADVAYNANPSSGYAIYDSIASPSYGTVAGWNEVGGTSAAAPQWSAIIALTDQQRSLTDGGGTGQPLDTNQVLTTLYNTLNSSPTNSTYKSVFHDIATGSDGYGAATGYDLPTGLGTPIVNTLVPFMAGTSIAQGGLPTITGSGYGGGGGGVGSSSGSSSGGGGGSSSTTTGGIGSGSFLGYSASSQPGGGLYAGSGSISILPGSAGANGLNGQPPGASAASATPQAASTVMPSAASVTISVSTFDPETVSAATGENNLLGQVSTLMPASPFAAAGSTTLAASTSALAAQGNNVFGASGWNGSALLGRPSSLDLSAPEIVQPADDFSQNTEEIDDQSADGAIITSDYASGEDSFAFDVVAPALRDKGDAHDGDDGDGGGGGDG